jgi:hypothetical protein
MFVASFVIGRSISAEGPEVGPTFILREWAVDD